MVKGSADCRLYFMEFTVPWDSVIDKAYERKVLLYAGMLVRLVSLEGQAAPCGSSLE